MLKSTLFKTPEKSKLLAYIGLCMPTALEYAAAVWNPNLKYIAHDIDKVHHCAVRFVSGLKGRDSMTLALENLNLETLAARSRKVNFCLNSWQMRKTIIHYLLHMKT